MSNKSTYETRWWLWALIVVSTLSCWYGVFTKAFGEIQVYGLITAIVLTVIILFHFILKDKQVANIKKPNFTGYDYESYVAEKFKRSGYTNVEVTPASGDYGADIICYKHGSKICVQCKMYSGPVGIDAVQQVIAAKEFYNCDKAVVVTTSTFTTAAKKLANKAHVELLEKYM